MLKKEAYKKKIADITFLKEHKLTTQDKLDYNDVRQLFNKVLVLYQAGRYSTESFKKLTKRLSSMHEGQEVPGKTDHDKHFYIILNHPFQEDGVFLKYYFTIEILGITISRHLISKKKQKTSPLWTKLVYEYLDQEVQVQTIHTESQLKQKLKLIIQDYIDKRFLEFFFHDALVKTRSSIDKPFHDFEDTELQDLALDVDELDYYLLTGLRNSEQICESFSSYLT